MGCFDKRSMHQVLVGVVGKSAKPQVEIVRDIFLKFQACPCVSNATAPNEKPERKDLAQALFDIDQALLANALISRWFVQEFLLTPN